MSTETSLTEYKHRIQRVIDHVNAHLAEDLPLEALADAACFSSFHFHRIFTEMTGETPVGFVNRLRLERSANMLLMAPSLPITEIALSCGFSSSATFSRSFKKFFGVSATEWRDKSKNCNTESKIGKAPASGRSYIEDVESSLHTTIERSTSVAITIQQQPAYHVAYAANLEGYEKKKIDAVWQKLCGWAGPHGLFTPEAKLIDVSFDNPCITAKDKCRYYACLTVPEEIRPPAGFGVMDLPAGLHAVKHFEGYVEGLPDAYRELYGEWLPGSGYQPANSPCYAVYSSTPDTHPEGKFVMDICLPIIPL